MAGSCPPVFDRAIGPAVSARRSNCSVLRGETTFPQVARLAVGSGDVSWSSLHQNGSLLVKVGLSRVSRTRQCRLIFAEPLPIFGMPPASYFDPYSAVSRAPTTHQEPQLTRNMGRYSLWSPR